MERNQREHVTGGWEWPGAGEAVAMVVFGLALLASSVGLLVRMLSPRGGLTRIKDAARQLPGALDVGPVPVRATRGAQRRR